MAKLGQRPFIKHQFAKRGIAASLAALSLLTLTATWPTAHSLLLSPAYAQRFNPDTVWRQVYEKLPDLPLENQYISRETGKVESDNTLVGRFIRYHIYVKGRPPVYRLDWKITLADYLGINEFLEAATYPSSDTLTKNPMESDIAAIKSLSRAQRDALVQTIVDIFNSAYHGSTTPTVPSTNSSPAAPQPAPSAAPANPAPSLREPQPGDANLLLP